MTDNDPWTDDDGNEIVRLGSPSTCECGWRGWREDMVIGDGRECPECGNRLLGMGDHLHG